MSQATCPACRRDRARCTCDRMGRKVASIREQIDSFHDWAQKKLGTDMRGTKAYDEVIDGMRFEIESLRAQLAERLPRHESKDHEVSVDATNSRMEKLEKQLAAEKARREEAETSAYKQGFEESVKAHAKLYGDEVEAREKAEQERDALRGEVAEIRWHHASHLPDESEECAEVGCGCACMSTVELSHWSKLTSDSRKKRAEAAERVVKAARDQQDDMKTDELVAALTAYAKHTTPKM